MVFKGDTGMLCQKQDIAENFWLLLILLNNAKVSRGTDLPCMFQMTAKNRVSFLQTSHKPSGHRVAMEDGPT